jgi:hypothetical protein
VVDRAVPYLIDTVTFTDADFSIQHDGVCRMNPELARRVAQLSLEHLSEPKVVNSGARRYVP